MSDIGIVINVDTRPGFQEDYVYCGMPTATGVGGACGARSIDFITHNVYNKIQFFRGHDIEVTLYVDLHENLPNELARELNQMLCRGEIHNLIYAKHTKQFKGKYLRQWQDSLYLNACMMSRSKYLVHFDADTSCYRKDDCAIIDKWIELLEQYKYISYPTYFSPNEGDVPGTNALPAPEGGFDYLWASTRFFMCKRETLDYNRIVELFDDHVWKEAHGKRPMRYPNVFEQIIGFLAGPGQVCYSPKDIENFMVFCWHHYNVGTIPRLNKLPYNEVLNYIVNERGGIQGACDIN
jgi:hypothetical protein